MTIWRRIKNIWRLGEYRPAQNASTGGYEVSKYLDGGAVPLKKDFQPTKKMATVVMPEIESFKDANADQ